MSFSWARPDTPTTSSSDRPIGLHVSISGHLKDAVERARDVGCVKVFQIFSCSPRRWDASLLNDLEVDAFRKSVEASGYEVFCHMPYLPNLCSPDSTIYSQSVSVLTREIQRCDRLGVSFLVVHFGSHAGTSVADGHKKLIDACRKSIQQTTSSKVRLLLENSAGVRNSVGSSFEHIKAVLEGIGSPERTGVCFDTCHAFASGYDLRTEESVTKTMNEFDNIVGKSSLFLIHMNDSLAGLGEARDRHESIGQGKIGLKGFRALLALEPYQTISVILETPIKKAGDDKKNLKVAKSLLPSRRSAA